MLHTQRTCIRRCCRAPRLAPRAKEAGHAQQRPRSLDPCLQGGSEEPLTTSSAQGTTAAAPRVTGLPWAQRPGEAPSPQSGESTSLHPANGSGTPQLPAEQSLLKAAPQHPRNRRAQPSPASGAREPNAEARAPSPGYREGENPAGPISRGPRPMESGAHGDPRRPTWLQGAPCSERHGATLDPAYRAVPHASAAPQHCAEHEAPTRGPARLAVPQLHRFRSPTGRLSPRNTASKQIPDHTSSTPARTL